MAPYSSFERIVRITHSAVDATSHAATGLACMLRELGLHATLPASASLDVACLRPEGDLREGCCP